MNLVPRNGLTFDDVLILPAHSEIESRGSIDISLNFLGHQLQIPIISANMDYITELEMALAMRKAGGLYVFHRFLPFPDLLEMINVIDTQNEIVSFSIGTRLLEKEFSKIQIISDRIYENTPLIVTVDVAHGDHIKVETLVKKIKYTFGPRVKVIAGNVATEDGFRKLALAGADAIKVGIGPGSVCTTRTVTGVGVPQLTAISWCAEYRDTYFPEVKIIADGGIKSSGDIVKALAVGADVVMLGALLAGTTETPGEVRIDTSGKRWRPYRGQSIFGTNDTKYTKEGVEGWVTEKGPVADVLKQLAGGVRSGLSYVGANNLIELRELAQFIKVSNKTELETHTRVITEIF